MGRPYSRLICAMLGALFLISEAAVADAETKERRLSTVITYRIPEGVYVNAGTEAGLRRGMNGALILEDGQVLAFDVMQATGNSALLRLSGAGESLIGSLRNRAVELVFEMPAASRTEPAKASETSTAAPFVPLLTPPKLGTTVTTTQNRSRGRVGIQQMYQASGDATQEYSMTRVDSSGSIDRLFGSAWSFIWSGNLLYRAGEGFESHPEFETIQPVIYASYMQHPLAGDGFARLGRFLPLELPGIGYLDGGQFELDSGAHWALGVAGGLKPNRVNLEFSSDEPTVAAYGTLEAGSMGSTYFSGTLGLLGSLYKGEPDRLALLFDERLNIGPRFNLFSTAELDFGVANTTNAQARLNRLDLNGSYRFHRLLTLRAGVNHWERIDSLAERDLLPPNVSDDLFEGGYWRYWIGGRHDLPWDLDLNEEVAYTVSEYIDDAVRWRVGLTRTGLFGWRLANVGATLYNLEAQNSSGYGWLVRAYLPFGESRFSIRPSASMRWLDPDDGGEGLSVSYLALHGDWIISRDWTLTGGITTTDGESAEALFFDLGLRYSW